MKYLISIALLGIISFGIAQSADMVKLKDGTKIKGGIIDYKVNQYVKIKTIEGNILEFPFSDIAKTKISNSAPIAVPTKGFYNSSGIGVLLGLDHSPQINLHSVLGYKWNDRLLTGIGVGFERYRNNYYYNRGNYFPLYLEARYLFRKNDFTPFISAKAGYAFNFSKKEQYYPLEGPNDALYCYYQPANQHGGIHTGIQLGIRNFIKSKFGYTISAGYTLQQTRSSYANYPSNCYYEYQYNSIAAPQMSHYFNHRFEIKLGLFIN